MASRQGPEANEGTGEIIFSEKEFRQSIRVVAAALSSGIELSSGAGVGEKIARSFDYKADKKLEELLEKFPGANKDLVERFLRGLAAGLREKS